MGVEINADLFTFLESWQTLLAGLVAFLGALITTIVLIFQHSFNKKKYREERQAIEFYMRSLLSDALSELIKYSENCFRYIYDETDQPNSPNDAISILKENIKYSRIKTSKNLFKIVSFYQVHNSRLDSYQENIAMNKKEQMFYDIAKLHYYFNSVFAYARNEEKQLLRVFPNKLEMERQTRHLIGTKRVYVNEIEFNSIFSTIEEYRESEERYSKPKYLRKLSYKIDKYKSLFHSLYRRVKGKIMSDFSRIKNMLKGSTTMPVGTAQSNVHYHNGVPCTGDHSHDHSHEAHDHKHHKDGSCCDHGDDCEK